MPAIEVDPLVYWYILDKSASIGEKPQDFLRRLVEEHASGDRMVTLANHEGNTASDEKDRLGALSDCFQSPEFTMKSTVVKRFLKILSFLYQIHGEDFQKILGLGGHRRKYFAKKEEDLGGTNVSPKKIDNSPYWVVTNNDTNTKKELLSKVLQLLGYTEVMIQEACNRLDR